MGGGGARRDGSSEASIPDPVSPFSVNLSPPRFSPDAFVLIPPDREESE